MGMQCVHPSIFRRIQDLQVIRNAKFLILFCSHKIISTALRRKEDSVRTSFQRCPSHIAGRLRNHFQRMMNCIPVTIFQILKKCISGQFIRCCQRAEYRENDWHILILYLIENKFQSF